MANNENNDWISWLIGGISAAVAIIAAFIFGGGQPSTQMNIPSQAQAAPAKVEPGCGCGAH